jgi:hypothetical protein
MKKSQKFTPANESARHLEVAKINRLRALRLTKEAAEKEAAQQAAAAAAASKPRKRRVRTPAA